MKKLIVIDMQNDFVNGSLGTKEAQAIVPNVIEKVKNFDGEVIFTKDTHGINYLKTLEGEKLPIEHCLAGTAGWAIQDDLQKFSLQNHSKVITKGTFGFNWFSTTNLNSATEIEIVGLCTDICVVSNALIIRAMYPNTKIIVDASCCAGTTPEKHKAALETMKSCQIDVINE